jgi:hypothetical protein
MLDLCDDLQRLRTRISDPEVSRSERLRLRRQTLQRVGQLTRNLTHYRWRGPLGRVLQKYRFSAEEFEVLSVLLQRTMRAEEPEMEGRLILGSVFETSFGVLSSMHLLHENARLRSSGLVTVASAEPATSDVLETRFRLSEDALESFRCEVEGTGRLPVPLRRRPKDGYRTHRDLLADLRALHLLYQQRSERAFANGRWDRPPAASAAVSSHTRQIDRGWQRVRERLSRSPAARDFPMVRLMRDHRLGDGEVMVVVHLLFRELYEGNAYTDTVELMRLCSSSEADLLRNRRLFAAGASLIREQLIEIEPLLEGRELTGEVHLNDWVVNDLLGIPPAEEPIQAEERLDWHLYLRSLEDSAGFYRDMQN